MLFGIFATENNEVGHFFASKNAIDAMIFWFATTLLLLPWAKAQSMANKDCANAIVVDPRSPIPIYGTIAEKRFENEGENPCLHNAQNVGRWYKFTSKTYSNVIATTCNDGTDFDTFLSVLVGNDCNNLTCVDKSDDVCGLSSTVSFLAEPNQTYWIALDGFSYFSTGSFNMTLSVGPSVLALMNPITDRVIGPLKHGYYYSYGDLPASRLNIQAAFEIPPKSVRVTFDNPPRNFCKNTPPFSVFGDSSGDFFDSVIPVGSHTVTATPFNATKCRGTAGPTLNRIFHLRGCVWDLYFLDVALNRSVGFNYITEEYEYLPCSLNIEADIKCGFTPQQVKLELRNSLTNTLVVSRVERNAPYYLFGDVQGKALSGAIPSGNYKMSVIVDGINIGESNFAFAKECAKNIPPNDACANAIPLTLNSSVPFQTIGDTSSAVFDTAREDVCFSFGGASGLWYKFTTPSTALFSEIVVTTRSNITTFDTQISVFSGDNCDDLTCYSTISIDSRYESNAVSSITISSQANQTFFILVHGVGFQAGIFQLIVEYNPNMFVLLDSFADRPIQRLPEFPSYKDLEVNQLNIQALYDPELPAPKSVRLTFDNPPRDFCKNAPPFSVFGDLNDNFLNAMIPIGNHTVTATSYSGKNCRGTAGPTRIQTFYMGPCFMLASVFDVAEGIYVEISNGQLDYLPCSINVVAFPYCGFTVNEVTLELHDTATNTMLFARIEHTAPYYLFGDSDGSPLAGTLPLGEYQLKVIVDGIEMLKFDFAASEACVPRENQLIITG